MTFLTGETPLIVGQGEQRREFVLVLDHRALIAAETAAGVPLALAMAQASMGFAGATAAMLFGALRTHHEGVTLDEAQKLAIEHMADVDAALAEATRAGFPDPKKDAGDKEPKGPTPKRRAGTSSGRSGAKRGSTRTASSTPPRASSGSS